MNKSAQHQCVPFCHIRIEAKNIQNLIASKNFDFKFIQRNQKRKYIFCLLFIVDISHPNKVPCEFTVSETISEKQNKNKRIMSFGQKSIIEYLCASKTTIGSVRLSPVRFSVQKPNNSNKNLNR